MNIPLHPISNIYLFVSEVAKKSPRNIALMSCSSDGSLLETLSYEALLEKMERALQYLQTLGLKEKDCIALAFTNSIDLLILSWSAWSMGIITIPLDTKNDIGELYAYKIRITQSKYLIVQEKIQKSIDQASIEGVRIEIFSGFLYRSEKELPILQKNPDHIALILFTSGTTGHPKGAQLSLQNLIVNADGIRRWFDIRDTDRFLVNLPLHHINSTTFCLSILLSGGSIAIPPTYSSSNFWNQVSKTQSTITSIVQSIVYDQLVRESEFMHVKNDILLNRIQIGSAPVIAHSALEFEDTYHIPLYQGYGQTETALRVTGVPLSLSSALHKKIVEENSIGISMPWADVQIASNTGEHLGENEEGELIVRGDAVMRGYVGKEPAFQNGYFLTGDIGYFKIIDKKKFFFLKGRKKEIIIKGGVNISPTAVENRLKKVSVDIDQVYVIGVVDDRYGEEVAAIICWKKHVDTDQAFKKLKKNILSHTPLIGAYEAPKYLLSLSPEKLPRTSTGKVQRMILKKQFSREKFEHIQ